MCFSLILGDPTCQQLSKVHLLVHAAGLQELQTVSVVDKGILLEHMAGVLLPDRTGLLGCMPKFRGVVFCVSSQTAIFEADWTEHPLGWTLVLFNIRSNFHTRDRWYPFVPGPVVPMFELEESI